MSSVKLIKWGNSIGIRIPATIIKEAHLIPGDELTITANENGNVMLVPIKNQQEGWTDMFNAIADSKQDEMLMDSSNEFDEEEWTW